MEFLLDTVSLFELVNNEIARGGVYGIQFHMV